MNSNYKPPLIAYIDLDAFRNNINIVKQKFPDSMIILPVKANAYGHDDIIISKEAEKLKIDYLGIARISEGLKLRDNKIKLPIINLGVETDNNIDFAIQNNIELTAHSIDNVKEIEDKAKKNKKRIPIHLKIDTGMRRLGCYLKEAELIAEHIFNSKNLKLKSIYTHFAKSFDDQNYTKKQTNDFFKIINQLNQKGIKPDFYHLYNSGAVIKPPVNNIKNAVRPGIMVYGYFPSDKVNNINLIPVMTLKSKIINLKEIQKGTGISYNHTFVSKNNILTGTIPLGYGDGFHRALSNKFKVTINNKNYKQLGTITMDLTVVQIDKNVKIGDEVIIFGKKSECINDAADLAKLAGTISYEITTSLNQRVERIIKK